MIVAPAMRTWRFHIDRGGTFTDVVAEAPDGHLHMAKFLSADPRHDDGALAGIRYFLDLPRNAPIPPDRVS